MFGTFSLLENADSSKLFVTCTFYNNKTSEGKVLGLKTAVLFKKEANLWGVNPESLVCE